MYQYVQNHTQYYSAGKWQTRSEYSKAWISPELAQTLCFPAIHGFDDYLPEGHSKFFIEISHHHLKNYV